MRMGMVYLNVEVVAMAWMGAVSGNALREEGGSTWDVSTDGEEEVEPKVLPDAEPGCDSCGRQ